MPKCGFNKIALQLYVERLCSELSTNGHFDPEPSSFRQNYFSGIVVQTPTNYT